MSQHLPEPVPPEADLFEAAPCGYVVVDNTGTIVRANAEFLRLVGAPAAELKSVLDLAQKAEATLAAIAPHVEDLVSAATAGADLASLHVRGEALKSAAASVKSVLKTGAGA